uniref:protein ALWAYS EARLY 3 isoform X2 n=1 Tax=Erigeron canadensis TaxID=72917 RepID=UPI001CB8AD78|nr:protein ALWAYS EARLY 3 isoform X2 [Erigeron canadensis]
MGPTRKSRSVNKRFLYDYEVSPIKDGKNVNTKNQRKKKVSDMLGPHWNKEELEHFYEAYRKHGRDWKKVAAVLRNRSVEMVEAVYTLNKAYLSLPEGTASVAGFIAMMTDYYSNMAEHDSEQERNDSVGTSRKPKKRKVPETTSKGTAERVHLNAEAVQSDYSFLSVLKKKRSGGSRPRVVGKRTPRFPVSHSNENGKGENYVSPTKKVLTLRADDEEDVAQTIAMALADASKRGGSPQVSQTPNRRSGNLMSSPGQSAERMYDESDVASGWFIANVMYDDDAEGNMEADNTEFSRNRSKERTSIGHMLHDRKGSQGRKVRVGKKENKHLNYIREDYSGTEGQNLGTLRRNFDVEVADAKPSRSSRVSKNRSKEAHTGREDNSAFDALETLASLSLMILPEANGTGKGYPTISRLEAAEDKAQTSGKGLVDHSNASSEVKDSHQLITKVSRKRQKIVVAPKILKADVSIHTTPKESQEAEAIHATQMSLSRRISQGSSPQLVKYSQHVSASIHSRREVHNSAPSDVKPSNMLTRVRNKRKMYKPEALEVTKLSDVVGTNNSSVHLPSLRHRIVKRKLSNCLSNQLMRRWCSFEWFYSAIDDPCFAKREFVEYLYHVGLGHVPRLTRVEWGVIRSSLGKPRRFSDQFLKEEKDKLNQYRDSVRAHYTELRSGSRDGLPLDLARPLAVGQRVIAIYPRTREIHDGTVLTVYHDRCCVRFDRPDLGTEIIMDTDCMPLNPFENLPASLRRPPVNKSFENLKEVNVKGMGKDQRPEGYTKSSSPEKLENMDEAASVKSNLPPRNGQRVVMSSHHAAYSMPGKLEQYQAKEADVEAISELTRALDKKEAVVFELRRMNDDVIENQTDGNFALRDSEAFKKQYAAVLVQLNEANAQVSSALFRLRQRNTYQNHFHLNWPRAMDDITDHGGILSTSNHTASHTEESECRVNDIVEISRTKARNMVHMAIQAMSTLKLSTVEIDKAVDYVNDRLSLNGSYNQPARPNPVATNPVHPSMNEQVASTLKSHDSKSVHPSDLDKTPVPSELITQCVATLFSIQKCTERQFPPAEVAKILDSAVSSLQPCSPQNLLVYADIQKCMGIIKNQILALVPT